MGGVEVDGGSDYVPLARFALEGQRLRGALRWGVTFMADGAS